MRESKFVFRIGIGFVILSCVLPLFAIFVPFIGFDKTVSTAVVAFLIVGGPEVCFILGVLLAGKQGAELVKSKFKKSAGKTRYYIGAVLFILCFISNWVMAYLEISMLYTPGEHLQLYLMIALDAVALISVFIMGPEFINKLKILFLFDGTDKAK
jgi:hypothetical protein